MHQHTGNWPGKTVEYTSGFCNFRNKSFEFVDLPGTYSIMSNSEEEEIARNFICFGKSDYTVIVVDATSLERNLNLVYQILEITPKVVLCVNLLDEAKRKGILVDLDKLSKTLGIPVVGTIAKKKKTLSNLLQTVYNSILASSAPKPILTKYLPVIEDCISILVPTVENILPENYKYLSRFISIKLIDKDEKLYKTLQNNLHINFLEKNEIISKLDEIYDLLGKNDISKENLKEKIVSSIMLQSERTARDVCSYEKISFNARDRKIDKILTSKTFGIPIMLIFLGLIFWITIIGANYPSRVLFKIFEYIQIYLIKILLFLKLPEPIINLIVHGIFKTTSWIVSVMLPPMAIFFPLFTFLEDIGFLPRIAFNLDNHFKKAGSSRKTGTYYVHGIWL